MKAEDVRARLGDGHDDEPITAAAIGPKPARILDVLTRHETFTRADPEAADIAFGEQLPAVGRLEPAVEPDQGSTQVSLSSPLARPCRPFSSRRRSTTHASARHF